MVNKYYQFTVVLEKKHEEYANYIEILSLENDLSHVMKIILKQYPNSKIMDIKPQIKYGYPGENNKEYFIEQKGLFS